VTASGQQLLPVHIVKKAYCLCIKNFSCRSKTLVCQLSQHHKTLKLLRQDGDQLQARHVPLPAVVARQVVAPITDDEDDEDLTRAWM
jgi:hypothetical protein